MTLGDLIKNFRSEHSISQDIFAERSGLSKAYVSILERNYNPKSKKSPIPSLETIKAVSSVIGMDFNDVISILDGNQKISLINNDTQNSLSVSAVRIPVLGKVAAGIPITAVENIIDYEEIPSSMAETGEYVALQIKGSSMEPRMFEGDVVIVKVQPTVDSGEVAVVIINGNEATVKKVQLRPDGIVLQPFNSAYDPMFYTNEDIESIPVRIFGKVVECRQKY